MTPTPSESARRSLPRSLFAHASVGRAGLGNMLFPWARAQIFAADSGAKMLAPSWARLRVGPYLRREPDKRRYAGFFHDPEHLHGWSRMWQLLRRRRVPEGALEELTPPAHGAKDAVVVEFSGLGEFFAPLLCHTGLIRDRLWRMTQPEVRSMLAPARDPFVAMHVRRGDITRQGFNSQQLDNSPQYTPLAWFVEMARAIRRVENLGGFPIVVFSDGDGDELAELLGVEGVELQGRRPAVTDLWEMSSARLLVASGFSTFSMWASYLGCMPTLYAPGKIQQRVQENRDRALEIELPSGAEIPADVIAATSKPRSGPGES